MFELEEVAGQEAETGSTVIKVVGVGGAGGNAVDHMIREGVSGVEFICCNTDAQALKKSAAHVKLQLGPGLGAGGKPEKARELAVQDRERIADARILIDQARLLVLNAADRMDKVGNKHAKREIAMIKVAAPNMACQVIDWAMQLHGGAGVSDDTPLAHMYAAARTIRFADGPDAVHRMVVARHELARLR